MSEQINTMADKCREMAAQSDDEKTRAFWLRMVGYWDRGRPTEK
jgi:hypothetical protein